VEVERHVRSAHIDVGLIEVVDVVEIEAEESPPQLGAEAHRRLPAELRGCVDQAVSAVAHAHDLAADPEAGQRQVGPGATVEHRHHDREFRLGGADVRDDGEPAVHVAGAEADVERHDVVEQLVIEHGIRLLHVHVGGDGGVHRKDHVVELDGAGQHALAVHVEAHVVDPDVRQERRRMLHRHIEDVVVIFVEVQVVLDVEGGHARADVAGVVLLPGARTGVDAEERVRENHRRCGERNARQQNRCGARQKTSSVHNHLVTILPVTD